MNRCPRVSTPGPGPSSGRDPHAVASRGAQVTVTGMANMAVKVSDLDGAVSFYQAAGAEVRDRMPWHGGERADIYLGPVMITLFTRALYEDAVELPEDCF